METIDELASSLFEEAKRHLEKAAEDDTLEGKRAFSHAALVLGICALEAHVNALSDELALRPDLSVLERSILLETDFAFDKGRFDLTTRTKFYRLTDRLHFIFSRFTSNSTYSLDAWWGGLKAAVDLRNGIVHPKNATAVTEEHVRRALTSVLSCLNELYLGVFKKRYPGHGRGLSSDLHF